MQTQAPLQYDTFTDVALTPAQTLRPILRGGLAAPQDYPDYCRYWRIGKIKDDAVNFDGATAKVLDESSGKPFVYGGMYVPHFGHFTAEFVHRLWVLNREDYSDCTVVFVQQENPVPIHPFFHEYMAFFGVKKWIMIREPTIIKKMVIASQGTMLGAAPHRDYARELELFHRRRTLADAKSPKKIAMLRGHMSKGRLLGEAAIEKYLKADGYTLYRPEEHPLQHQFQTIFNAEKIIISEGSACHLFDVMLPIKAEVAYLARRPISSMDLTSIAGKARSLVSFKEAALLINPDEIAGNRKDVVGSSLSYIPYEKCIRFLKREGFVSVMASDDIGYINYFADMETYITKSQRFTEYLKDNRADDLMIKYLSEEVHSLSIDRRHLRNEIKALKRKQKPWYIFWR